MSSEEFMSNYIKAKEKNQESKMVENKNNWMKHYSDGRGIPLKIEIVNPKIEEQFKKYYNATMKRYKEDKKKEKEMILRNLVRQQKHLGVERAQYLDERINTPYVFEPKIISKRKPPRSRLRNEMKIQGGKKKTRSKKKKTRSKRKKTKKNS